MNFIIIDCNNNIISKKVGNEVLHLQKGNGIQINEQLYEVQNKYIDYDKKTVEIYVTES